MHSGAWGGVGAGTVVFRKPGSFVYSYVSFLILEACTRITWQVVVYRKTIHLQKNSHNSFKEQASIMLLSETLSRNGTHSLCHPYKCSPLKSVGFVLFSKVQLKEQQQRKKAPGGPI